ncbi:MULTISPECIES: aromatic acid exporter family protein [Bacillaceae]|uniref:FUSC family protein n=1 Tax=Evansella alkalicola TaxID=745819 RepID=A0ABS6JMZ8_9BACI|nr:MULTISPECIES: aromatic acid exporter family protein [Bacillaceae]MBU9719931.1 FUSC family protein [Bacillus alkalicola]
MIQSLRKKWIGNRIIKTAIAVFITAFICIKLNLPAEFAVIAAIVTIEPTASDSLRKGLVRFPASAIGAALAALFVGLLGNSPITFMLAAVLTIILCQKLNLKEGTLVATLTAVAMIPDIHDHYFLAFLSRLGTTMIGLTVSTIVNLFVLPPKYIADITSKTEHHISGLANVLIQTVNKLLKANNNTEKKQVPDKMYQLLKSDLEKTIELLYFQKEEWKFHKIKFSEYKKFQKLEKTIFILDKMTLHLGNLQFINKTINFNDYEQKILSETAESISYFLLHLNEPITDEYFYTIYELDQYLKYEYSSGHRRNPKYFHHFHEKTVVFYELLSIHDSLEELHQLFSNSRSDER